MPLSCELIFKTRENVRTTLKRIAGPLSKEFMIWAASFTPKNSDSSESLGGNVPRRQVSLDALSKTFESDYERFTLFIGNKVQSCYMVCLPDLNVIVASFEEHVTADDIPGFLQTIDVLCRLIKPDAILDDNWDDTNVALERAVPNQIILQDSDYKEHDLSKEMEAIVKKHRNPE